MHIPILTFEQFNAYLFPFTIAFAILVAIATYVALQCGQKWLIDLVNKSN